MKQRDSLLNKLLARHEALFPGNVYDAHPDTPMLRMQQLIERVPIQQLISDLAFTLRQITVDELCSNPELYPSAFVGKHDDVSPEKMRRPDTWIDESSIAALSNKLNLPIIVNVVECRKILPKQIHYNVDKSSTHPCVLIKLEDRHYVPLLNKPITAVHITPPQRHQVVPSPKDELAFNRSMSEILGRIADDQIRIKNKFESIRQNLEAFILLGREKGGLNKDDLLAIYVKWMNCPDNLNGKKHCAGIEHGYQHFFDTLSYDNHNPVLPINQDAYITHELIHAIARAISIGHMHADVIYKDNEDKRSFSLK